MTEQECIDYFENLAAKHKQIQHRKDQKQFFYIENPDELNSFDEALRNVIGEVCMLLVTGEGELDDNNSENHVDEMRSQLYILIRKRNDRDIGKCYDQAKMIMKSVIERTKTDFRGNPKTRFRIDRIPYSKVGPMNEAWYGYTFLLTFICPFGFKVGSGTWLDK